jgi:hypothetical protein
MIGPVAFARRKTQTREPQGVSLARRSGGRVTVALTQPREAALSTTEDRSSHANGTASIGSGDMKLEVLVIPVSDVEVTARLPGRVDAAAPSFGSASDLASAMVRAALAHGEHEKRTGAADPDWPDWYAAYMVAEQAGTELPT